MNKYYRILIIAVAIGLFTVAGTMINSRQAIAQAPKGSAPVTIVNPLPVPVFNVDNAARSPFQVELCAHVGQNFCGATPSSFAVPTDRRAVIEYASGRCPPSGLTLNTGEDWAAALQTTVGGIAARHLLHPVPGIAIGSPQLQSAMQLNGFDVFQLVRIYADPGSLVNLEFLDLGGLGNASIFCTITISGYTNVQ